MLLAVLPAEAGALLRFTLQRFSPSPPGTPSPGPSPHAVRASAARRLQGLDRRGSVGADTPRSSPGFLSSRASVPPPARHSLETWSLPALGFARPRGEGRGCASRFVLRRTPFTSLEVNDPSWSLGPHSHLRLFGPPAPPGLSYYSSAVPPPFGGFQRLRGAASTRPEFDREEMSVPAILDDRPDHTL